MVALEESVPVLSLPSPAGLEVVSFQVCYNKVDSTMCALYVAPNSDLSYLQSLLLNLSHLIDSSSHVILLGDFNFHDIY